MRPKKLSPLSGNGFSSTGISLTIFSIPGYRHMRKPVLFHARIFARPIGLRTFTNGSLQTTCRAYCASMAAAHERVPAEQEAGLDLPCERNHPDFQDAQEGGISSSLRTNSSGSYSRGIQRVTCRYSKQDPKSSRGLAIEANLQSQLSTRDRERH